MPVRRHADWHNGRVMNRVIKTSRVLVPALACSLALAACGGTEQEEKKAAPSSTPSTTVSVPDGVTLTDLGSRLAFGEKATVAYEPNKERSSVLEITVKGVQRASISELGSYVLDDATSKSVPYYVTMDLTNVGQGDLGRTEVPIFLVDSTDTLVHSSSFTNTFKPCPSTPFPDSFAPAATLTTCQLYLVPEGAAYKEMSFRPVQDVEPIVWEGDPTNTKTRTQEVRKAQKKAGN